MLRTIQYCLAIAATVTLIACAPASRDVLDRSSDVRIQRTANGVAHIEATDAFGVGFGVAYAHAQDNVCQTADHLVTARGERSRYFGGGKNRAQLGRRLLPNEQLDFFIAAHMNDAELERNNASSSAEAQELGRGYVQGYNRFLADHKERLPAACNGRPWVTEMTLRDYHRLMELTVIQAGIAAFADAMVTASPPKGAGTSSVNSPSIRTTEIADAATVMREMGLLDSPLGSNAWAFGKDSTANGRGLLLGNPHFPWTGVNRFWQMHLTIPGKLDVMGASIGHAPVVQIGFNKDVAWSHTVSTGKRFTLYELKLDPADPTTYWVDGQAEKMKSRVVQIKVKAEDGSLQTQSATIWTSRWGPLVVVPRAGLTWNAKSAYALKDANAGNTRSVDAWLGMARAQRVDDIQKALGNLGTPWVNTIAADRLGQAMYADASVVPDVDAAQLTRCSPSKPAAALLGAAGLVVLNGSKADCDWRQDPTSAMPGLIPMQRLPIAVRTDWVHNSNDSFFYSHPDQKFGAISPMVGDDGLNRARTRAGLLEIPQMLKHGKADLERVQQQLFANRNFMAHVVLPDLLAACAEAPSAESKDGCVALGAWNRHNNLDARGAHLFREFWRTARTIPGIHRAPFDKQQPVATPSGVNMKDSAVASKVWNALDTAVKNVRRAGFALDAALGDVQRPAITALPIGLHGGDEIEGVLNNLGRQDPSGIEPSGLRIDYGTSYVQTVTFDDKGPVAQALLTYGQSTDPASPFATDQLSLYAKKIWPALPFHPQDVVKARIGPVLELKSR